MKQKNIVFAVIVEILTVGVIAWILSNSLTPGTESHEQSTNVLEFLSPIAQFVSGGAWKLDEVFVRRLAHFTEYAILGLLLGTSLFLYLNKKGLFFTHLAVIFLMPVVDELIQLIPEGRSCSVETMLIDLSGEIFGVLVVTAIYFIIRAVQKKKSAK